MSVVNNVLAEAPDHLFVIKSVTHADDTSIEKHSDRNRVGQVVKPIYPLSVGYPLRLVYVGGEKDGRFLHHSRIKKTVAYLETGEFEIYTKSTMYILTLKR